MPSPKQIEEKIRQVLNAWRDLASTKSFAGMALDQAEAKFQPSFDRRQQITQLENQIAQAINQRDDADEVSLDTVQLLVNAVMGDPTEGRDSPLIEAMGYTRKSERKTGLTRKKTAKTTPAKE
ncbi:MAG TPA: hypothetical protein VGN90_07210 [Pyrinomonadaceae bacterium]|nr:hypothetical protein [Pyrinomonadaceae bacterium]